MTRVPILACELAGHGVLSFALLTLQALQGWYGMTSVGTWPQVDRLGRFSANFSSRGSNWSAGVMPKTSA